MANDPKNVSIALARALATRQLPQDNIDAAARTLGNLTPEILKLDICPYGFCGDWWFTPDDLQQNLLDLILLDGTELGAVRIFKYGIVNPDFFHVQAEMHIDGLEAEAGLRR